MAKRIYPKIEELSPDTQLLLRITVRKVMAANDARWNFVGVTRLRGYVEQELGVRRFTIKTKMFEAAIESLVQDGFLERIRAGSGFQVKFGRNRFDWMPKAVTAPIARQRAVRARASA